MSPNEVESRVSVGSDVVSFGTRVNVWTVPTLEVSGHVSSSGSWLPTLLGSPKRDGSPGPVENFLHRTTFPPAPSSVERGLTIRPSGKSKTSVRSAWLAPGEGGTAQS